jgi:Fic family protein
LLDLVRSDGDWEAWLVFFLEGVHETATNAVVTAQQLIELMKQDSSKVQNLGRASISTLRVFYALCQRPISSVKELSNQTQLSFPATMKGINQLVKLQIVKEITGNRRNRIFAYESYLKLLNDTP